MLIPVMSLAQSGDTVWVNTLNFKDITKRKGTYQFPTKAESWQQIKMHYTLKCDPQTTQDNYACGEWDYLSYTIVHDSTGVMDSTALQHPNFKVGDDAPDSFAYVKTALFDTLNDVQYTRMVDKVNSYDSAILGVGSLSSTNVFKLPRTQYLFTIAELTTAGLKSGLVTSISFNAIKASGNMNDVTVRMTSTGLNNLMSFVEGPFTTVFNGNLNISGFGEVRMELLTPFMWDGVTNIVLEISHGESAPLAVYEMAVDNSLTGVSALSGNKKYRAIDNGFIEIEDAKTVFGTLDSMVTIAFWCKGNDALPLNTSFLEASDASGNRVLNIHLPWSNGSMYWDAGNETNNYDRINKVATTTNIKNVWNYWAFVKNAKTGEMKIYLNGSLWHSGTTKNRSMNGIEKFRIGRGTSGNQYKGDIDRFSVWKDVLTETEIMDLMNNEPTAGHSKYSSLIASFNFDNYDDAKPSELWSSIPSSVKANLHGIVDINEYGKGEHLFDLLKISHRPMLKFIQADQTSHLDSTAWVKYLPRPKYSIALFENTAKPAMNTGFDAGYKAGYVYSFHSNGSKKDSSLMAATTTRIKKLTTYYKPFEVVDNIEIARYITPYGIGFDLGADGFRWEYDVTDYAYLLHDQVTLSSGNQQELHDLTFEFIKGTPPRDVKRIDYYVNRENRSYKQIADDAYFKDQSFDLHADAKTFKLITRITGHGHNTDEGKSHCCEWANKKHYIKIDGKDALEWDIWQNDKCALNPLIDQGGNWAPPRAGWCPGAPVDDYNFDITKNISGNSVRLNYEIEPVPTDNLGQGGGNYVVSLHLVEYGDWKRQNDATISQILNPTSWEFFGKFNPTCATPKIMVKNTGGKTITSALIRYGVMNGVPRDYKWTGSIASDGSAEVDLPFSVYDYVSTTNSQTFFAEIIEVNGVKDEYPKNSRAESTFDIPKIAPTTVEVWFRTNSVEDATVVITNDKGQKMYEKLDAVKGVLNRETVQLNPGCYKLECVTENGFGLYYPLIPEIGNGLLRISGDGFSQSFNPDFGKSTTFYFTVAYPLSTDKISKNNWNLYPNPGNGLITIEANGNGLESFTAEVVNMKGQVIFNTTTTFANLLQIDIQNQPAGVYLVRLQDDKALKTFKVIKN